MKDHLVPKFLNRCFFLFGRRNQAAESGLGGVQLHRVPGTGPKHHIRGENVATNWLTNGTGFSFK